MTDLASLVVRLEAEIGKYSENLDKANRQLKEFGDDANSILEKVGGALAAYLTFDALEEWGARILENGDRLQKFSQTTGIAVDELSRLEYALKSSGVPAESLGGLMKSLSENISEAAGNAKSDAALAFKALGIQVRDAAGHIRNGREVLDSIADRFQGYADGANKSAAATALLGKAGGAAVPFLNQGSEGIKKLADESDRLGNTISGKTAAAAEEFNDRVGRLKTTLVDGIGNAVAARVLPTLNALGAEFEDDADSADAFAGTVEPLVAGLKLLGSVGIGVGATFGILANQLASMAVAQEQFFTGEFRAAAATLKEGLARNDEILDKALERVAIIWREGGDKVQREIKDNVEKIKAEAPNLAGGKELEKAADAAIKKLTEMSKTFAEQIATFGLGEAEATKYRLTLGNLSDDVEAAGKKGRVLADTIEAQAKALQKLKDTKEITKALSDVEAQIQSIKGNAGDAAIAQFDAKNAELVTKLRREGNLEGQKQLESLLTLTVAQADYNTQATRAQQIQADLADTEERLRNSREAGALTELGFQKQLGEARKQAATDLAAVATEQAKIAEQIGNPQLIADTKRLGTQIDTLRTQAEVLGQSIRAGFEDSFADELNDVIDGSKKASEAFGDFVRGVARQLTELATKNIAQSLFGGLDSAGGGGGGGGLFSALAGLFAGGKATGGHVSEGMAYRVNERTPNSEWFVPDHSGSVVPAAKMGGSTVVNRISVSIAAPSGQVSRATQLDTAARAARAVTLASRRNN